MTTPPAGVRPELPGGRTMPWRADDEKRPRREFHQLLRLHERLLDQLLWVRHELASSRTVNVLREIRNRTGSSATEGVGRVTTAVEQAIRALKVSESELRQELSDEPQGFEIEGIPNLPAPLARFLARRAESPGFRYDVLQDPIRGWIVRWKEYSPQGEIRGCGQFYERPYAWLDE